MQTLGHSSPGTDRNNQWPEPVRVDGRSKQHRTSVRYVVRAKAGHWTVMPATGDERQIRDQSSNRRVSLPSTEASLE